MKLKNSLLSVIFVLVLSSCTSIPLFQPHVSQSIQEKEWKDLSSAALCLAGKVSVEAELYGEQIKADAEKNLGLLINEYNINSEGTGTSFRIDVSLREAAFIKGYRPLKTLSLTMRVLDESGDERASWFYSVESENSFYSSAYLHRQLKKGFGKLF